MTTTENNVKHCGYQEPGVVLSALHSHLIRSSVPHEAGAIIVSFYREGN